MKKSLTSYLIKYYKIQEKILLVYRPDSSHGWGDRCFYLGDDYSPHKNYNHRSLLDNEVVIEFDNPTKSENRQKAEKVSDRLHNDNIEHNMWYSGGKSYHIHTLIDSQDFEDIHFFKRVFVKHYTYGIGKADMQLCGRNQLIRAECGIHEKNRKYKSLKRETEHYPFVNDIKEDIKEKYHDWITKRGDEDIDVDWDSIKATEAIQFMMDAKKFRQYKDGRSRALFILIHVLKHDMSKEELISFLQKWYKNAGGKKLSPHNIREKVEYHWNRTYRVERKINDLLNDIGATKYMLEYNN